MMSLHCLLLHLHQCPLLCILTFKKLLQEISCSVIKSHCTKMPSSIFLVLCEEMELILIEATGQTVQVQKLVEHKHQAWPLKAGTKDDPKIEMGPDPASESILCDVGDNSSTLTVENGISGSL